MTQHLSPEDLPPPSGGLAPADDAAAIADVGPPSQDNPVAVGIFFLNALCQSDGPQEDLLEQLVTPESRSSWGDSPPLSVAM